MMTIAPSSRREVLVRGGTAGTYELLNLPFNPTPTATQPQQTLATVSPRATTSTTRRRRATSPTSRTCATTTSTSATSWSTARHPPNFYINGEQFNDGISLPTRR